MWQRLFEAAAFAPALDYWLHRLLQIVDEDLERLHLEDSEAHQIFAPALALLEDQPHLASCGSEAMLSVTAAAVRELCALEARSS